MNDFTKYQTELKNILDDSIQHYFEARFYQCDYYFPLIYVLFQLVQVGIPYE